MSRTRKAVKSDGCPNRSATDYSARRITRVTEIACNRLYMFRYVLFVKTEGFSWNRRWEIA